MARWTNPPTEEERMRMQAALETRKKKQELLSRELLEKYSNWTCSICHKSAWTQVVCRKHGGSVCMKHCMECEHYSKSFQNCLYRKPEKLWTEWAAAESMIDLLCILTTKTHRDCVIGAMNDDCAYRVIDKSTGQMARGVVRFFEGAWHYGTYETA